ncbi:hypothetical protein ACT4JS_002944, partial [Vibrio cholerae]
DSAEKTPHGFFETREALTLTLLVMVIQNNQIALKLGCFALLCQLVFRPIDKRMQLCDMCSIQ